MNFDLRWVRKYDRPGPRYTSYPTAPNFEPWTAEQGRELLIEYGGADRPLSLYVHLPYCRSVCYFCACNVIYTKDQGRTPSYVDTLIAELDLVRALIAPERRVVQLHFGGGTPTFLPARELERLWQAIVDRFPLASDAEVSIELDPREVDDDHLAFLREAGFTRASIGVQDFDPRVQEAVHRIQPRAQTQALVEALRAIPSIEGINFDLIYGLPYQTSASFAETIATTLELAPDRIALFNFAYLPELKKHQRRILPEALPAAEEKLALMAHATDAFLEAGYVFVGMDHFARPDDELVRAQHEGTLWRNFQGYTTRGGVDLLGFGVTSIGIVGGHYLQNLKQEAAWRARIEAGELPTFRGLRLKADDRLRREVIMELMCHFRIDKGTIASRHGIDFDTYFADALAGLEPFADDGLVELAANEIRVTPPGRYIIRNIAMLFDRYLAINEARGQRFSRTV